MVQASVLNDSAERPLRILCLVTKPPGQSPGQRFRLEQWTPRLAERHGITLDFHAFESERTSELLPQPGKRSQKGAWILYDFARRLAPVLRARTYDAVVVFREAALIGPAIYERLLVQLGVPMFFDFDDAIWHPAQLSSANGIFSKLHFFGKTSGIIARSAGVTAGNEYLADYARGFNSNVFIVPTSIELDRYPLQPESNDDRFVIVWSGSHSTLIQFEEARAGLERLAAKRPITIKMICNVPPTKPIKGAENVFVRWSEHGEAEALGAAHVGVMPLPDNGFTRGKCGLKGLQYMAVGRPVVMSPVGMNNQLVQHGENGFLAATADDWTNMLDALAESPELRARVGAAGRKTVESNYSSVVVAARFADAVRSTLAQLPAPR